MSGLGDGLTMPLGGYTSTSSLLPSVLTGLGGGLAMPLGGYGVASSSANAGTTTTAESIRDRIIEVIASLTPTMLVGDRFIEFRNEGEGDFVGWAETYVAGCLRRFQVRDTGDDAPAEVTDGVTELRMVTFEILVAYPQSSRFGQDEALERDDVIAEDLDQIEHAIGEFGRGRFVAPHPEAAWVDGSAITTTGNGVDMLVIQQTMVFWRSMA